MKRLIQLLLLVGPLSGCAHLLGAGGATANRATLWVEAHHALSAADFPLAEERFGRLFREHPRTGEGRESLFYLGALRLDPRNPEWDSLPAEDRLREYLALMQEEDAPRLYRYPEARILYELARQLNLPPDSRMAALQPEERVVRIEERVVVPARVTQEISAEVARLRQQIADRDAKIRQQEEELERIRRTLTRPP